MLEHLLTNFVEKRARSAARLPAIYDARFGRYKMPFEKFIKYFIGVCVSIMLVVGLLAPALETSSPIGLPLLIIIGGIIVIFCVIALVEVLLIEIEFSDRAIFHRNRLTPQIREVKWNQISSVTYSTYQHWFVFKTTSGQKIRMSHFRIGFNDFASFAGKHLSPKLSNEFSALIVVHLERFPR